MIKNIKIGLIGTSKSGKSTFITNCMEKENIKKELENIISKNKFGQTKVRINYRFNMYNDSCKLENIELKSYEEYLDNIKIEELEKKELKNLFELGVLIKENNEYKILAEEEYEEVNKNIKDIIEENCREIEELIEKINTEEAAKVIGNVVISTKIKDELEKYLKNYELESIEFVDTRGLNDIDSNELKYLEESLLKCKYKEVDGEECGEVDLDTNENKEEVLKSFSEIINSKLGIESVQASVLIIEEEAISGTPAKVLTQIIKDIITRMPTLIVQKSQNLKNFIDRENVTCRELKEYKNILEKNSKILREYHFCEIGKENLIDRENNAILKDIYKKNIYEYLLPDIGRRQNPSENEIYNNIHGNIFGELIKVTYRNELIKLDASEMWGKDREKIINGIKSYAKENVGRYTEDSTIIPYPNLIYKGYRHNLNKQLKDIKKRLVPIIGPRGGVTPFQKYYEISAVSITSTDFIKCIAKEILEKEFVGHYKMQNDEELEVIVEIQKKINIFLEKSLYENDCVNKIFSRKYHSTYPRSTERRFIQNLVESIEIDKVNTENYLLRILEEFLNRI